ncbi:GNAT family N-acetyltransferase [Sulfolobus sp. S-194]|uniref:GNAT family N-acetyltransferase n=1 Tax=Sulfolobus sp. S-194 TaxID=2512240 RepID=UPI001436F442|nr:GNAT family N-acetyltransferase [Sulfolobus sp. S-194]QIW24002.1 GNAT family N-acetyltransferase [Sulfolobus sp. S-194]
MIIREATYADIKEMTIVWGETIGSSNIEANKEVFSIFLDLGKCLVVEEGEKIISTACYIPYHNLTWIGNVGVKTEYQRKGIGRRIMIELLNEIKTRSIRLDATNAGYKLYKDLGFEEEYKTVVYDISQVGGKVRAEETEELEDWMLKLDKRGFGDDRAKLFSRIRGKVVYNEGGFGIVYRNVIGPLIAVNERSAEELIRYAVSNLGVRLIITPKEEFIKNLGGKKVYECKRMRKGDKINEDIKLTYGIFRYSFG